ncbi:MAG: DUF6240 domain-containing protein [Lachnospiraceae bacterium]|nr:DUF6240 domain-containing protein [Lachnospiraceae bacterium]
MNNNLLKEISDYVSPVHTGKQGIADLTQNAKVSDTEVRDLDSAYRITKSVKLPKEKSNLYGKNGETLVEEIERRTNGNDETRLGGFVLSKMTTTGKDLEEMSNSGFSPMDMDPESFVTVGDKIKVQLAKAGKDISMMGGISKNAISNIANSDAEIRSIEEHLNQENLPSDKVTIDKVKEAYNKCEELGQNIDTTISEDAVKVLIKNGSEPTIKDVYSAFYSTGKKSANTISNAIENTSVNDEMSTAIEKVIKNEGLDVNNTNVKAANWLMNNDLSITGKNISQVNEYLNMEIPDSTQTVRIVDDALREGRDADQAYLVPGYSMYDKAAKICETQVSMTKEAGVILQKLGIDIDTTPIEEMADKLHELSLMGLPSDEELDLYKEVNDKVSELKNLPAETIGAYFKNEDAFFLNQVKFSDFVTRAESQKVSMASKSEVFMKMEMTYEGVGTEVRKDLGDSIQKAFRNVDDLLDEINMEKSVENERAVRILGYNGIEINEENVSVMKLSDQTVQRVFNNMKPGVVLQMIKDNKNPLDMTMEELNANCEDTKQNMSGQSDDENYAEFLWKIEHSEGLTTEEKESYIGIFRLMHQVNKSDGAVIGHLVHENVPITMRNLMMAVRTRKNTGNDIKIDDDFGFSSEVYRKSLSVTEQVEMAFETQHLKNAEKNADPYKFKEIEKEKKILELSPYELDMSLQKAESNEVIEKEWRENLRSELKAAVETDAKVQNIIARMDLDETPVNITAVRNMLYNNRRVFSQLAGRHVNDDGSVVDVENPDIRAMMQQVIERFGEDSKTPEEMAEAQEKLANIAEHAMDEVLLDSRSRFIDIRTIQAAKKQMGLFSKLAKDDIYHLPITVATESGVLRLKIVKGEKKAGLVDIFLETGKNNNSRAKLKVNGDEISGEFLSDDEKMEEFFKSNEQSIVSQLEEASGMKVSMKTKKSNLDVYDYLLDNETADEKEVHVDTSKLYKVAKAFVKAITTVG